METEKRNEVLEKFHETSKVFREMTKKCYTEYRALHNRKPSEDRTLLYQLDDVDEDLLYFGKTAYKISIYMNEISIIETMVDELKVKHPDLACTVKLPNLMAHCTARCEDLNQQIMKAFDDIISLGTHYTNAISHFGRGEEEEEFHAEWNIINNLHASISELSYDLAFILSDRYYDIIEMIMKDLYLPEVEIREFIFVDLDGKVIFSKKKLDELIQDVNKLANDIKAAILDSKLTPHKRTSSRSNDEIYVLQAQIEAINGTLHHRYVDVMDLRYIQHFLDYEFERLVRDEPESENDTQGEVYETNIKEMNTDLLIDEIEKLIVRKDLYRIAIDHIIRNIPSTLKSE